MIRKLLSSVIFLLSFVTLVTTMGFTQRFDVASDVTSESPSQADPEPEIPSVEEELFHSDPVNHFVVTVSHTAVSFPRHLNLTAQDIHSDFLRPPAL